jgi:hypothetical protein
VLGPILKYALTESSGLFVIKLLAHAPHLSDFTSLRDLSTVKSYLFICVVSFPWNVLWVNGYIVATCVVRTKNLVKITS